MTGTLHDPLLDIIRCYVGAESYALEMSWVESVDRAHGLRGQPADVGSVGFVADAGRSIPVFSLAGQLGRIGSSTNVPGHVIVLRGRPGSRALWVDRTSQVLPVPGSCVNALPSLVSAASPLFFRGILKLGRELVLLLDPHRLIPGFSPERNGAAPAPSHSPVWKPPPDSHGYLPSQSRNGGQIVIFSVAASGPRKRALSFGLSITQVLEILDPPPLVVIPHSPTSVLGLVDWQGRPTPVIDLASRLGLTPQPPSERARMMIARASLQADPIGFLVRPSIRICRLPLPHLPCRNAPPVDPALTRGAIELKNETLVIPDLAGITSFSTGA